MPSYHIEKLTIADGSWAKLEQQWQGQCAKLGEDLCDYAPDVTGILKNICSDEAQNNRISQAFVYGIREEPDSDFLTICMVNRAMIPRHNGYTLRVRHVTVCPDLDFGVLPRERYSDALVWTVLGVISLASAELSSEQVRFHLGSPEDADFFRAFRDGFNMVEGFTSVDIHGAWLYLTK